MHQGLGTLVLCQVLCEAVVTEKSKVEIPYPLNIHKTRVENDTHVRQVWHTEHSHAPSPFSCCSSKYSVWSFLGPWLLGEEWGWCIPSALPQRLRACAFTYKESRNSYVMNIETWIRDVLTNVTTASVNYLGLFYNILCQIFSHYSLEWPCWLLKYFKKYFHSSW